MSFAYKSVRLMRTVSWIDVVLTAGIIFFIYALVGVAREWAGPYQSRIEIDLSLSALPRYGFFSLVRGFVSYGIALGFAIAYGYLAAQSKRAELFLIPLLDILQSIPVLGFLPGLVIVLVNFFPGTNIGLELASVLMIFTSQAWNMTMSFYSSVKGVPTELREVSALFRLRRVDVLRNIEIPHSMNGLLWNSMLSMAGGWFFLMVSESFRLGEIDFRLPGLGSYMTVAIERGDAKAVFAGIVTMVLIIVFVDRCFWTPLVVWSERFKTDREGSLSPPRSVVLDLIKHSRLLRLFFRWLDQVRKRFRVRRKNIGKKLPGVSGESGALLRSFVQAGFMLGILLAISIVYFGVNSLQALLSNTTLLTWVFHLRDTFFTLLRVVGAVVLGALWTIPVGILIGTRPGWTRTLQPVVQMLAAFPAPMLFPLATAWLARSGLSFEIGSMLLMLLGSQWYILFNVISGAMLIPHNLLELGRAFGIKGWNNWKSIILPGIFPSLLNGLFTAAGGAWNASIVTEFVTYGSEVTLATGIGSSITQAAQLADFPKLAGGIVTMVLTVVLFNYFVWRELYKLAETRFKIE